MESLITVDVIPNGIKSGQTQTLLSEGRNHYFSSQAPFLFRAAAGRKSLVSPVKTFLCGFSRVLFTMLRI